MKNDFCTGSVEKRFYEWMAYWNRHWWKKFVWKILFTQNFIKEIFKEIPMFKNLYIWNLVIKEQSCLLQKDFLKSDEKRFWKNSVEKSSFDKTWFKESISAQTV